jgi:maltose alpha-D-glucosyltransferase/alpha-amylase
MRYLPGMPDVEGAVCNPGYNRAGCRTPMQWDDGPNAGFSTADPARLYLPVDPDPARPTVAAQEADPGSTLHLVRALTALRRATPALQGRASIRVVHEGYPFAWVRGESHLVVVNPRREPAELAVPGLAGATPLLASGLVLHEQGARVEGFGYGIVALPAAG